MTGGSGSAPPLRGALWTTGLPRSSFESSEGGAGEIEATATTTSLAGLATRLVFLTLFPDFDPPSSPPTRFFFFFPRPEAAFSSSEVAIWLLAACSADDWGGAWPDGVGMGPYAPGGGG